MKVLIKADNGKLSKVIEYDSGERLEIPINKDGSIRWLEDRTKDQNVVYVEGNEADI